jgi:hypothetical protein
LLVAFRHGAVRAEVVEVVAEESVEEAPMS